MFLCQIPGIMIEKLKHVTSTFKIFVSKEILIFGLFFNIWA